MKLTTCADLELYFARSLGFALTILASVVLFFTGTIPLSTSIRQGVSSEDDDPKAPYAVPLVRIITVFHSVSAIYCYVRWTHNGPAPYMLGAFGYGVMAAVGMWCIMFGTSGGRISKRTGADKRTTGFPFKNVSAYNKRRDKKQI